MNKYELTLILDKDLAEDKREEIIEKYKDMITNAGGEVALEKWGMKKFAYPINFKTEGYYILMNVTLSKLELISEMSKLMNITDGIVRHMFVKK